MLSDVSPVLFIGSEKLSSPNSVVGPEQIMPPVSHLGFVQYLYFSPLPCHFSLYQTLPHLPCSLLHRDHEILSSW